MVHEESQIPATEVTHRQGNLVRASPKCALVNKLIIYITMFKEKAPIYKLSRSKAPKHSKFAIIDMWEIVVIVWMSQHSLSSLVKIIWNLPLLSSVFFRILQMLANFIKIRGYLRHKRCLFGYCNI